MASKSKVVVIGGGTGSFVVLSGLKKYPVDITAIVSVTDSGGSTGRLRTEFGFLPVGDMRQCLAALAKEKSDIRKILLYRFSKGKGLNGHNLGNLILTGLTDIYGSEPKALAAAASIFNLHGEIFPITTKNIELVAVYKNSMKLVGEHQIDEPKHKGGIKIVNLKTKPHAYIYDPAKKAIIEADLIILSPGDLYTSILPNLIIGGVKNALRKSKAKLIYIVNLMTRFSQTPDYKASDHVNELERYLGKKIDILLINNKPIPNKFLKLYSSEKGFPVVDDLKGSRNYRIIRKNFLSEAIIKKPKGDWLQRSYLRHDSERLAKTLVSLLK